MSGFAVSAAYWLSLAILVAAVGSLILWRGLEVVDAMRQRSRPRTSARGMPSVKRASVMIYHERNIAQTLRCIQSVKGAMRRHDDILVIDASQISNDIHNKKSNRMPKSSDYRVYTPRKTAPISSIMREAYRRTERAGVVVAIPSSVEIPRDFLKNVMIDYYDRGYGDSDLLLATAEPITLYATAHYIRSSFGRMYQRIAEGRIARQQEVWLCRISSDEYYIGAGTRSPDTRRGSIRAVIEAPRAHSITSISWVERFALVACIGIGLLCLRLAIERATIDPLVIYWTSLSGWAGFVTLYNQALLRSQKAVVVFSLPAAMLVVLASYVVDQVTTLIRRVAD